MRFIRQSILGLGFALTVVSAGHVSAQAFHPAGLGTGTRLDPSVARTSACDRSFTSTSPASGTILAARKNCDAALAACMNAGGNPDTCWNAYWRCIS